MFIDCLILPSGHKYSHKPNHDCVRAHTQPRTLTTTMVLLPNLLDTTSAFSFVLSCDDDYDKENNHNNEKESAMGLAARIP